MYHARAAVAIRAYLTIVYSLLRVRPLLKIKLIPEKLLLFSFTTIFWLETFYFNRDFRENEERTHKLSSVPTVLL